MIDVFPFILLTFAIFRLTRFFLFDTIIEGSRLRWYTFLANRKHFKFLSDKLTELTSCSWCFGVHVSYIVLGLYLHLYPWNFGVRGWLTVAGLAGAAGLLHAFEPED